MLAPITDTPTLLRCRAERALLRTLEGGCRVPIGVFTKFEAGEVGDALVLEGAVWSVDGSQEVRGTESAVVTNSEQAIELGNRLAERLVAGGAKAILDAIAADEK
jgi:hydroxymethylbilane synthase